MGSLNNCWVLFENRPAFYFCNYIFITAHNLYNFRFRIKDTVILLPIIIMILILKILLHNVYKIINLWYPTYVYQIFNFPYDYKNRVLACFQTRPQLCLQGLQSFQKEAKELQSNFWFDMKQIKQNLIFRYTILIYSWFCCTNFIESNTLELLEYNKVIR